MAVLRPLLVTRLANCIPGVALLLLGAWAASRASLAVGLLLLTVVVSAVVGGRGYRMGVTVTGTDVVVRGFLRSRTVSRNAVLGVGHINALIIELPAVRWRSASGKVRRTPVTTFGEAQATPYHLGTLAFVRHHNAACMERLTSLLTPPPNGSMEGNQRVGAQTSRRRC